MRKGPRLIRPTWLALSVAVCMALPACGSKTTSGQDKIGGKLIVPRRLLEDGHGVAPAADGFER
jgi:hypothetical protein